MKKFPNSVLFAPTPDLRRNAKEGIIRAWKNCEEETERMEGYFTRRLILASGSARRRELLENCGYEFEVRPSSAREEGVSAETPALLVEKLALMKARAVFDALSEEEKQRAVVLGSDTVVVLDGQIIGKPRSKEEACEMLRAESGRENTVFTGVAVVRYEADPASGGRILLEEVASDAAVVRFSMLTEEEIADYVATGDPLDKAGAYGIQGRFSAHIERVEGSYFTVVGLPVHLAYRMLKRAGIAPKK